MAEDYIIPVGASANGYRLLRPLPVEKYIDPGVYLWTKSACLDEWGIGDNLEEAVADLISSLVEYQGLLKRVAAEGKLDADGDCALNELSQLIAPDSSTIVSSMHNTTGNS